MHQANGPDLSSAEGAALHQWTGYWEQAGIFPPLSRYSAIGWLASANMKPVGRHVLDLTCYALRQSNVCELSYQTWERGTGAWEHILRRFATAFHALPAVIPAPFECLVAVVEGPPADESLWVRRFGDRVALLNDAPYERIVQVCFGEDQSEVVELGRNRRLTLDRGVVSVQLLPYDLLVFATQSQT